MYSANAITRRTTQKHDPRAVMQQLSLTEWKIANRLPVRAGEMTLSRLAHHGWIETRGEHHHVEVRLTETGLKKMRSKSKLSGKRRRKAGTRTVCGIGIYFRPFTAVSNKAS